MAKKLYALFRRGKLAHLPKRELVCMIVIAKRVDEILLHLHRLNCFRGLLTELSLYKTDHRASNKAHDDDDHKLYKDRSHALVNVHECLEFNIDAEADHEKRDSTDLGAFRPPGAASVFQDERYQPGPYEVEHKNKRYDRRVFHKPRVLDCVGFEVIR